MTDTALLHEQTYPIIVIGDELPHVLLESRYLTFELLTVDTVTDFDASAYPMILLVVVYLPRADSDTTIRTVQAVHTYLNPSQMLCITDYDPPILLPDVLWQREETIYLEDVSAIFTATLSGELLHHQYSHQLTRIFANSTLHSDSQIYQELQAVSDVLQAEGVGIFIINGATTRIVGVNIADESNFNVDNFVLPPDSVMAAAIESHQPQTLLVADEDFACALFEIRSASLVHITPMTLSNGEQLAVLVACDLPALVLRFLSPSFEVLGQRVAESVEQRAKQHHYDRQELLLDLMGTLLDVSSVDEVQQQLCTTVEQIPMVRQAILWQQDHQAFTLSQSDALHKSLASLQQSTYFDPLITQFNHDTEPIYLYRDENAPENIQALFNALRTTLIVLVPLYSGKRVHSLVMVAPFAEDLLQHRDVKFIALIAEAAGRTLARQRSIPLQGHQADWLAAVAQHSSDGMTEPNAMLAEEDINLLRQLPVYISTYQARAVGLLRSLSVSGGFNDVRQTHIVNNILEELQVIGSLTNDVLKILLLRQPSPDEAAPTSFIMLDQVVQQQINGIQNATLFRIEKPLQPVQAQVIDADNIAGAVERLLQFLQVESHNHTPMSICFTNKHPFCNIHIAHQLAESAYTQLEQAIYADSLEDAAIEVNLLSLYLVQQIILQEQGFITLNPTEIVISLPSGAEPESTDNIMLVDSDESVIAELDDNNLPPTTIHPVETIVICIGESEIMRTAIDVIREAGYELSVQRNIADSLWYIDQQNSCDLILVDDSLRGEDALEFATSLRNRTRVPIVLMGDRENVSRANVLEHGIDTYLTQPIAENVMLLEIKAMIRRSPHIQDEPIRVRDLEIDLLRYTVTLAGDPVDLTRLEYKLLRVLAINAGQVLEYEQLLRQVWGPEYINDKQHLYTFINRLRRKLEIKDDDQRYIHTRSGVGYILK